MKEQSCENPFKLLRSVTFYFFPFKLLRNPTFLFCFISFFFKIIIEFLLNFTITQNKFYKHTYFSIIKICYQIIHFKIILILSRKLIISYSRIKNQLRFTNCKDTFIIFYNFIKEREEKSTVLQGVLRSSTPNNFSFRPIRPNHASWARLNLCCRPLPPKSSVFFFNYFHKD